MKKSTRTGKAKTATSANLIGGLIRRAAEHHAAEMQRMEEVYRQHYSRRPDGDYVSIHISRSTWLEIEEALEALPGVQRALAANEIFFDDPQHRMKSDTEVPNGQPKAGAA